MLKKLFFALFFVVICLHSLHAQTDYRKDPQTETINELFLITYALSDSCSRFLKSSDKSPTTLQQIKSEFNLFEQTARKLSYGTRYNQVVATCELILHSYMIPVFSYTKEIDKESRLLSEFLDKTKNYYQDENFPISYTNAEDENSYYTIYAGDLFNQVNRGITAVYNDVLMKKDSEGVEEVLEYALDNGMIADENSERQQLYLNYYIAKKLLNRPNTELFQALQKTIEYTLATDLTKWVHQEIDITLLYFEMLETMDKNGETISLSTLMKCAEALGEAGNSEEKETVYKKVLSKFNRLNIDDALLLYDFFVSISQNEFAEKALDKVDHEYLGCVNLSVMGYKYEQINSLEKSEEYKDRYKKCMREHKNDKVGNAFGNFFDFTFGWMPSFWREKTNLAISVNPIVGINVNAGTRGDVYNFMPMSVDLRTGKLLHEFRWNPYWNYYADKKFTTGNIALPENINEDNNGWQSLDGNDFSYALTGVVKENESDSYDPKWKSYHAFGLQYLWGNFKAGTEKTMAYFNNDINGTEIELTPQIFRRELLVDYKYSRFYTKFFYYTIYIGAGLGERSITYNATDPVYSEEILKNTSITYLNDSRLFYPNWTFYKLAFRAGIRIGITIK